MLTYFLLTAVIVFEEAENFRETRKPDLGLVGLARLYEGRWLPRRQGLPSQSAGYEMTIPYYRIGVAISIGRRSATVCYSRFGGGRQDP